MCIHASTPSLDNTLILVLAIPGYVCLTLMRFGPGIANFGDIRFQVVILIDIWGLSFNKRDYQLQGFDSSSTLLGEGLLPRGILFLDLLLGDRRGVHPLFVNCAYPFHLIHLGRGGLDWSRLPRLAPRGSKFGTCLFVRGFLSRLNL